MFSCSRAKISQNLIGAHTQPHVLCLCVHAWPYQLHRRRHDQRPLSRCSQEDERKVCLSNHHRPAVRSPNAQSERLGHRLVFRALARYC